jgi:hypothetical protein
MMPDGVDDEDQDYYLADQLRFTMFGLKYDWRATHHESLFHVLLCHRTWCKDDDLHIGLNYRPQELARDGHHASARQELGKIDLTIVLLRR